MEMKLLVLINLEPSKAHFTETVAYWIFPSFQNLCKCRAPWLLQCGIHWWNRGSGHMKPESGGRDHQNGPCRKTFRQISSGFFGIMLKTALTASNNLIIMKRYNVFLYGNVGFVSNFCFYSTPNVHLALAFLNMCSTKWKIAIFTMESDFFYTVTMGPYMCNVSVTFSTCSLWLCNSFQWNHSLYCSLTLLVILSLPH